MCSVYKATELATGRLVAIKVLLPRFQSDQRSCQRFQQEARATSKLQHPNIAQLYAFGVHDNHNPYIVMEYIDGCSLADVLKEKGLLTIEQTLLLLIQVCEGLTEAHSKNIIHRDLKPSNIMLPGKLLSPPLVKIVDFGIAKIVSEDSTAQPHLTQTGDIFGSPLYMSPEQCDGRTVDRRSDLYALGCIMYECLSGSPPHVGKTALETIIRQKQQELISLKQASLGCEFPEPIEALVSKLLSKDPDRRYQSAADLSYNLERFLEGYQPDTSTSGPAYQKGKDFHADMGAVQQEKFQRLDPAALAPAATAGKGWAPRFILVTLLGCLIFGVLAMPLIHNVAYKIAPPASSSSRPPILPSDKTGSSDNTVAPVQLAAADKLFETGMKMDNQEYGIKGHTVVRVAKMTSRNGKEREASFVSTDCSSRDALSLLSWFKDLQVLDLTDCQTSPQTFAVLVNKPLRHLSINHCHVQPQGFVIIGKIPSLLSLSASNIDLDDDDLETLNPHLRQLNISGNKITDRGVAIVARRLPNLQKLSLDGDRLLTDKTLETLAGMKKLENISLHESAKFSDAALDKLRDDLPQCIVQTNVYSPESIDDR